MKYLLLGFAVLIVGCTVPPVDNQIELSDTGETKECSEVQAPVCAAYQVQCFTTPCPPIKQTYNNKCLAKEADAEVLFDGVCGEEENKPYLDNSITPKLPDGDFYFKENGGFSGNAYIYGYTEIVSIPESYCQENCTMYQGIFLNALDSSSDSFQEFLVQHMGNAYVGENKVMIGCLEDGKIFYDNNSDELGRKYFEISEMNTLDILSATQDEPRVFRIMKLPLSWGSGTPACYSHFAEVEIVK